MPQADGSYVLAVLGRAGEPLSRVPVHVTLRHACAATGTLGSVTEMSHALVTDEQVGMWGRGMHAHTHTHTHTHTHICTHTHTHTIHTRTHAGCRNARPPHRRLLAARPCAAPTPALHRAPSRLPVVPAHPRRIVSVCRPAAQAAARCRRSVRWAHARAHTHTHTHTRVHTHAHTHTGPGSALHLPIPWVPLAPSPVVGSSSAGSQGSPAAGLGGAGGGVGAHTSVWSLTSVRLVELTASGGGTRADVTDAHVSVEPGYVVLRGLSVSTYVGHSIV
jgi:hypothetical protein